MITVTCLLVLSCIETTPVFGVGINIGGAHPGRFVIESEASYDNVVIQRGHSDKTKFYNPYYSTRYNKEYWRLLKRFPVLENLSLVAGVSRLEHEVFHTFQGTEFEVSSSTALNGLWGVHIFWKDAKGTMFTLNIHETNELKSLRKTHTLDLPHNVLVNWMVYDGSSLEMTFGINFTF